MLMNILFIALFLVGFGFIFYKIAENKGWALPLGLTAFVSSVVYWFNDLAWVKDILSWFN